MAVSFSQHLLCRLGFDSCSLQEPLDGGESAVIDRVADGMMFGRLMPCGSCGGAIQVGEFSYSCSGYYSAWYVSHALWVVILRK